MKRPCKQFGKMHILTILLIPVKEGRIGTNDIYDIAKNSIIPALSAFITDEIIIK